MVHATAGGGGGGPGSVPTGNLILHLEADDLSATLSDGDRVSTWVDRSAAGNDATQATSANQPLYKTGIVNGHDVVRFDSPTRAEWLDLPNLFSGATAGEGFIVVKVDTDPPGNGAYTGLWAMGSTGTFSSHYPWTDGIIYEAFGAANRKTTVNPTPSLADWRVYNVSSAASDWKSRLDGTQIHSTASNTVVFTTVPYIGRSADVAYCLDGDIAAVLLYDTVLSSGNRDSLETYLGDRFGITMA